MEKQMMQRSMNGKQKMEKKHMNGQANDGKEACEWKSKRWKRSI